MCRSNTRLALALVCTASVLCLDISGHTGWTMPAQASAKAGSSRIVLDDVRATVERVSVRPGEALEWHTSGLPQLLVFIKGGTLRPAHADRSVLWRAGRIVWRDTAESSNDRAFNVGVNPIDVVRVTFKTCSRASTDPRYQPVSYPNVAGEDLLENGCIIVQRFGLEPGQWEGPHGHGPNSLWIFVRGGMGASRSRHEPEHRYPKPFADGELGWMQPIDASEGHESGNVDTHATDWIWVTLKK